MNPIFQKRFPKELATIGYADNKEYLDDNIKQVKMLIDGYISYINGRNKSREHTLGENFRDRLRELYTMSNIYVATRLEYSNLQGALFSSHIIRKKFDLNDLEWTCLIVSVLISIDDFYKDLLFRLDKYSKKPSLTYENVIKIFYCTDSVSEIDDFYNKFVNLKFKMSSLFFRRDSMIIDTNVFYFLTCGETKLNINGVKVYLPDGECKAPLEFGEKTAKRMSDMLKSSDGTASAPFSFYLYGPQGIGKKTIVKRACELMLKGVVIVDLRALVELDKEKFYDSVYSPLREALIMNAAICFDYFEVFKGSDLKKREYLNFLLNTSPKFAKEIFMLSDSVESLPNSNEYISIMDLPIENPTHEERCKIWQKYLKEIKNISDINVDEISNKFTFNPAQIKKTIEKAKSLWYWKGKKPLTHEDICRCAYSQSISKISDKAILIKTKHTWDELVLEDSEKGTIKDACAQIRYRHIVYDKWGMSSRILYGRGLSMLFAGPPGTGKTMAAQIVAGELGLEIYKVDISQMVSKYIGETEKNLNDLFTEAQKSNVILLFDETDALFGKRTEIKDSHDKNANIETSYLLQKMEEYDGVTIMTTNYLENIDKAFFRRIGYVVHFPFPDQKSRKKIWLNMFPQSVPLDNSIDFDYLSEKFELSGGSIKNIAVNSAFMAAKSGTTLQMAHILKALKYELKKQGKVLIDEDFAEYSYLI